MQSYIVTYDGINTLKQLKEVNSSDILFSVILFSHSYILIVVREIKN